MSLASVSAVPALPRPVLAAVDRAALERELRQQIEGEVRFDTVSRALYSTDASVYQIEPIGVVVPKTEPI